MIYELKNSIEAKSFLAWAEKAAREGWVVESKRKFASRSISQNAYLHLILGWFASQYGCSMEEAKLDYFKKLVNPNLFAITKINRFGKQITTYKSSKHLDSAQTTLAIERFRNWSAQEGGIYLPSPNEEAELLFIRKTLERESIYI